MSPRRSSRAKTATNSHSATHHSSSSSSSSTRATSSRHRNKENSPDNDRSFRAPSRDARSSSGRMNSAAVEQDDHMSQDEDDDDVDDDEEEEVTRCLCGHAEYQGDDGSGDSTSDGFFIQCDKCHVWQHGFCVGIMDSSSAPDEYWCEKCKPDLHKLITKPHGQKSSIYLPVHTDDSAFETMNKDQPSKRRSTMNSRDAAYDESAILARILEESKHDAKGAPSASGRSQQKTTRKRGGSETPEETKPGTKRARTDSSEEKRASSNSDDERGGSSVNGKKGSSTNKPNGTNNGSTTSTSNNSAKRTTRRNEKASKDSKKDDSENSDGSFAGSETTKTVKPKPAKPIVAPPTASMPTPKEDLNPTVSTLKSNSLQPETPPAKRRQGTNGRRRRGKLSSEDPHGDIGSPHSHAMTRDHSHQDNSSSHHHSKMDKPSKPRLPQAKMSMKDMSKRVAMISDFIARTQIDMASKPHGFSSASAESTPKPVEEGPAEVGEGEYAQLRSTEMMDVLTRKIVMWQKTYS